MRRKIVCESLVQISILSFLAGFFVGNTAERILDQVDCSVLTVKPAGFQTPVTLD